MRTLLGLRPNYTDFRPIKYFGLGAHQEDDPLFFPSTSLSSSLPIAASTAAAYGDRFPPSSPRRGAPRSPRARSPPDATVRGRHPAALDPGPAR
jgi:hypothetical protein